MTPSQLLELQEKLLGFKLAKIPKVIPISSLFAEGTYPIKKHLVRVVCCGRANLNVDFHTVLVSTSSCGPRFKNVYKQSVYQKQFSELARKCYPAPGICKWSLEAGSVS